MHIKYCNFHKKMLYLKGCNIIVDPVAGHAGCELRCTCNATEERNDI